MRCLPLRLLAALSLLLQTPALAVPYSEIRWTSCTTSSSNRFDPSSTTETAAVSFTGVTGKVREVAFRIQLWAGGSQVSDAWRYDGNGCEGGLLKFTLPRGSSLCPAMTGANRVEASQVDYLAYAEGGWSKGRETIRYSALFDPMTAIASTTYTVALVHFDHPDAALGASQSAGSCGCLERPLCISLLDVHYVDDAGQEHTVQTFNSAIHWNDPGNSLLCPGGPDLCNGDCPSWEGDTLCVATTPATMQSWGRVKASYR
jgi:hypothetical protein